MFSLNDLALVYSTRMTYEWPQLEINLREVKVKVKTTLYNVLFQNFFIKKIGIYDICI
jgi:hypothetical protein